MASAAPDPVRVCAIYDDEHRAGPNFLLSWPALFGTSVAQGRNLQWAFKLAKGYDIAKARNEAVEDFLATGTPWLLFVDTDMGWEPDALEQLLDVADPAERPIVGALCFGFSPTDESAGEANGMHRFPFPTIYDLVDDPDKGFGFRVRYGYRPQSLQRVFATGAAFLLLHRDALTKIAEASGPVWFTRQRNPKGDRQLWGEDVSFCARANGAGVPVYVDTRVRTSHWKPVYVSEAYYFAHLTAPPADEEVDVIVPVLGRPHHAEPFMRSLRASTGLAAATAMLSAEESSVVEAAWTEAGARVVRCESGRSTFARKVNDGFRVTERPWVLCCGSDVAFRAGWWDHALHTARLHGADVVSTNDSGNGQVRDGLLAVHPVFRRSYIKEHGGGWDGPGVVAHEGYKHWWVDAEWSLAARQRGAFVFAQGSIVEHLHPHFGRGESDEVYELGQKFKNVDRDTFEYRVRRFAKAVA